MTSGASAALNTDYTSSATLYPENTYALVTSSEEARGDGNVDGWRIPFTENAFYEFREGKIGEVWSIMDKAAIEAELKHKPPM